MIRKLLSISQKVCSLVLIIGLLSMGFLREPRVNALSECQEAVFNSGVLYADCEENLCQQPGEGVGTGPTSGTSLTNAVKVSNPFTGQQIEPTAIILHWTTMAYGSNPEELMNVLRGRVEPGYPNGRAVQLTINKQGTVYQLAETLETRPMQTVSDQGWNDKSIGIEIESVDSLDPAVLEPDLLNNSVQYQAVLGVVRQLMTKYNIENIQNTGEKKGIFGHLEVTNGNPDPGANYMAKVRADLDNEAAAPNGTQSATVAAGCVCSVGSGNFTGSNNQEIAFNYLVSKGLSTQAAAGFVGNFMVESTPDLDPTAVNETNHRGIAQWDNSDRWPRLLRYAEATGGRDPLTLSLQLEFVWFELTGESTIPAPGVEGNKEHSTYEAVILAQTPTEAAEIVERLYERAGGDALGLRISNAESVHDTYASGSVGGDGGCSGLVNAEGYAFPLEGTKSELRSFTSLPCTAGPNGCHHDGTPAFDLIVGSERDATLGRKVYAIHDGTIKSVSGGYNEISYCSKIQLEQTDSLNPDDDGWVYAYLHIENATVTAGQQVKAGQQIAEVGRTECALNTQTHLHIDRGSPKGHVGGADDHRDPGIIDLINALYEQLL